MRVLIGAAIVISIVCWFFFLHLAARRHGKVSETILSASGDERRPVRGTALRDLSELASVPPELRELVSPYVEKVDFGASFVILAENATVKEVRCGRYGGTYAVLDASVDLSNSVCIAVISGKLSTPFQVLVE